MPDYDWNTDDFDSADYMEFSDENYLLDWDEYEES